MGQVQKQLDWYRISCCCCAALVLNLEAEENQEELWGCVCEYVMCRTRVCLFMWIMGVYEKMYVTNQ